MSGGHSHRHDAPGDTYANHGNWLCDRIGEIPLGKRIAPKYTTYYATGAMLQKGFTFGKFNRGPVVEMIRATRDAKTTE